MSTAPMPAKIPCTQSPQVRQIVLSKAHMLYQLRHLVLYKHAKKARRCLWSYAFSAEISFIHTNYRSDHVNGPSCISPELTQLTPLSGQFQLLVYVLNILPPVGSIL
jgi:hypothetical protein